MLWKRLCAGLRRPEVVAGALCICFALGFFCGACYMRRGGTGVAVLAEHTRITGIPAVTPVRREQAVEGRLNINTANARELEALPGIGPKLAERIIAYREEYGDFLEIAELMDVPGIGAAILEKLQDQITVG